jgi:hypothetical protein
LEPLADFGLYVSVAGIQQTKSMFKSIDVLDLKITFANNLYTFHYFDQPASYFLSLVPQKECSVPLGEYCLLWLRPTGTNNKDFPRLWNLIEQYVRAYPSRPPSGGA